MHESNAKRFIFVVVASALIWCLNIFLTPHFAGSANTDSGLLVSVSEEYFQNTRNGAIWTTTRSKRLATTREAQAYLNLLNKGSFDDWRLPSKQELFDLFSIFDLKNNGEVKIRIEGKYWLADGDGQISVGTWEIGEGCGPERRFFSGGKGYVRAIRP